MPAENQWGAMADRLKAVADPNRVGVLLTLVEGNRNSRHLLAISGGSLPNLSHHLGILRASGLVAGNRDGRSMVYSLTEKGAAMVAALRMIVNVEIE